MVLFKTVIQIPAGAMDGFSAQGGADRARISIIAIGSYTFWFMADRFDRLLEEGRGCLQITRFAEHSIDEVSVAVDSSVQLMPAPVNFQVGFVDVPRFSRLPTSF